MPDLKAISEVLIKKGKVRGKPVAITLFKDTPPASRGIASGHHNHDGASPAHTAI